MKITKQDVFDALIVGISGGIIAATVENFLKKRKAKKEENESRLAYRTIIDEVDRYGYSWKNRVSGKIIIIEDLTYKGGLIYIDADDNTRFTKTPQYKHFLEEFVPCEKENSL